MPPMIVRNTIGPISIRMASTNVVPIGCIAVPTLGHSQPTRTPRTIATITQKYNCRYHLVFLGAGLGVDGAGHCSYLVVGEVGAPVFTDLPVGPVAAYWR